MTLARDDFDEVARELESVFAPELPEAYRARYNIAPTDPHLMVRLADRDRLLVPARWGFVPPPKRGPLINVRAESVARGSFHDALAQRRCVVPADGFYEWTGPKEARRPFWIHRVDGKLLLFAGLYQDPVAPGEAPRFTVLTTTPNQLVAPIHDRMPVVLAPADLGAWLARGDLGLLRPAPDDVLRAVPVSTRVNSVKNDDPACLAPAGAEAAGPTQLRLV